MLKDIGEVVPAPAALAIIAWAGLSYFATGPEIAVRIARAEHLPVCEMSFRDRVAADAARDRDAVPPPMSDGAQVQALESLRRLQDSPMMRPLRDSGLDSLMGLGAQADILARQIEERRRQAEAARATAIARIEAAATTRMGRASDHCGCVADAAIAETRTEWALYAGSLGFIRQNPIRAFDGLMDRLSATGVCPLNGRDRS